MADSDDWVVVGGKGRPRRTPEQQQKHIEARAAAAKALAAVKHTDSGPHQLQHHHGKSFEQLLEQQPTDDSDYSDDFQVPEVPTGCSPAQYAAQQQLAILAAAMAKSPPSQQQQLPGWGPPPDREWKTANSSKSRRKGNRFNLPRTSEEQVQYIAQQIEGISKELLQTQMYASLRAAMQQVEAAEAEPEAAEPLCPPVLQSDKNSTTASSNDSKKQRQQQQQGVESGSSSCWSWQDVQQLVVYGLGSPEDSKVSRHQLALVLLLRQLLPNLQQPPQLYDPAFTAVDKLLMQHVRLEVIQLNEECRRQADVPTLFYLPHLEGALCDNLLDANWSCSCLSRLAILGNSFTTYDVRWSAPEGCRPKTRRPDKLLQLLHQGAVMEVQVPDHNFNVASAFNDTSLHVFRPAQLADLGP